MKGLMMDMPLLIPSLISHALTVLIDFLFRL